MEISEVWITLTRQHHLNDVVFDSNDTSAFVAADSINGQSVTISPYSFSAVLMLLMIGANTKAKSQMSSAFFPGQSRHHLQLNHLYRVLNSVLPPPRKGMGFHLKNEIFMDRKCVLNDTLEREAKEHFGVTIKRKNFHNNPIGSVTTINRWIKRYTGGKFDSILTPDMITKDTLAVYLNAMTFNMKWRKKFHPVKGEQKFYVSENETIPLTMIRSIQQARYGKFNVVEVLVLPLKGKQLNLVVILPENPDTLPDFEKITTINALQYLKKSKKYNNVDITLPKLFLNNSLNFKDYLPKVGVNRIFDVVAANFNQLFEGQNKTVYVSDALHNVVTKMNDVQESLIEPSKEEGNPFPRFIANRPFIFYIVQNMKKDNVVVFMGRYVGK